jgi:hypothetical protein
MTHEQIIMEAWRLAGEPMGNMDPTVGTGVFDATAASTLRWGMMVDAAARALQSWKSGAKSAWFSTNWRTYRIQLASASAVSATDVTGNVVTIVTPQVDSIYEFGGEQRYSVGVGVGTAIVNQDFTVTGAQAGTLYLRSMSLASIVGLRSVQKVKLLKSDGSVQDVEIAERGNFLEGVPTVGTPSTWWKVGTTLYFDKALEESVWVQIVAEVNPDSCIVDVLGTDTITGSPIFPEQFHYGMILWMIGWGYGVLQDVEAKNAAQIDYNNFMASTMGEMDTVMVNDQGIGGAVLT